MIKLGKKMNVGGNNMNKYDYDNMLSKIRLLEIKLKRIQIKKIKELDKRFIRMFIKLLEYIAEI